MLRADGKHVGVPVPARQPAATQRQADQVRDAVAQRNGLDVPPGVGPKLADPRCRCGSPKACKKADCGAQHGLCIVALSGVWNWLAPTARGGKMALAGLA